MSAPQFYLIPFGSPAYGQCSLHARLQSAGFYLKQGYVATSAVFWEVTLPHVEMKKRLTAPRVACHKKTPPV